MNVHLYVEGGAKRSKLLNQQCREGFGNLLRKCGFAGRMPSITACGSRENAFDDFKMAFRTRRPGDYIGLLVDSEDPIADSETAWSHLKTRDNWDAPAGATDENVLLMATCMETWIVADRAGLRRHYGAKLRESNLPRNDLESRDRHDVQDKLAAATAACKNAYSKGKRSFLALAALDPETLKLHLPSFKRAVRILDERLPPRR